MEGTMSEIRYWASPDFSPKSWAFCQGQTLAINTNTALFSLLGTTYGGNGVTTFCLPDFRSRTPTGTGQAGGITTFQLGETAGTETVTLSIGQMPAHNHPGIGIVNIPAYSESGTQPGNDHAILAGKSNLYSNGAPNTTLASLHPAVSVGIAGGNQPISLIQPYLAINVIICVYGIFPSRN